MLYSPEATARRYLTETELSHPHSNLMIPDTNKQEHGLLGIGEFILKQKGRALVISRSLNVLKTS